MKPHDKVCSCGAAITFRPHPSTGNPHPFNEDGTSHFATCPDRPKHKRKQSKPDQMTLFGEQGPTPYQEGR